MSTNDMEAMAAKMAAETGASLEECRAGIRLTMIRLAVGLGVMTLEQANKELGAVGLMIRTAA